MFISEKYGWNYMENIEYMDPYSYIFKKYGQQYDIWPGGKVGLY